MTSINHQMIKSHLFSNDLWLKYWIVQQCSDSKLQGLIEKDTLQLSSSSCKSSNRPVHSAPIRLCGSPMALKHTSAIAGAVSWLRLPVPALTEPNFRLSALISSSGSESRTLVVEKQKVSVDLCHLRDLENFWKNLFLEIVWNVKYTHKKIKWIYVMKRLSRSQSWKFGSVGAIETELELEPKSWKFSSQPAPKWALELKAEWLSFAWTGLPVTNAALTCNYWWWWQFGKNLAW